MMEGTRFGLFDRCEEKNGEMSIIEPNFVFCWFFCSVRLWGDRLGPSAMMSDSTPRRCFYVLLLHVLVSVPTIEVLISQ